MNTNQQARILAARQLMRGVKVGGRWLNSEPAELKQLARKPDASRDPRRTGGQY